MQNPHCKKTRVAAVGAHDTHAGIDDGRDLPTRHPPSKKKNTDREASQPWCEQVAHSGGAAASAMSTTS